MKNYFSALFITLIVSGCASKTVEYEYANLPVTQNALQSAKWSQLARFPALYPKRAALNATEGCATVEYVVTPQNEIKDVKVVSTTDEQFGIAAVKVVKNWQWAELPTNIITQAVKTQTRFDFCLDKPNQPCASITPEYTCPSEDIIYSSGMRVVR